ncbi:hypothetical protein [Bacillus alveayuensis]|uniref:hypothetical protein n=1 Tax=Aeribacillus alveayuensis TaxID=279215 RepID=UPI0005CD5033|nr:hypothetical protein [Bacillus alveayuensis]
MYHVMYSCIIQQTRIVKVMDFENGQIIHFTMDELEKGKLPKKLENYVLTIKEKIESGYWDQNSSFDNTYRRK